VTELKRFSFFILYGIIAVVLESTLLSDIPSSNIHFDFILYAIISLALLEDQRGVIFIVFALGILMDTVSSAPFGLAVFSYLIIYGFIRMIVSRILIEAWIARFVWVGVASLLEKLIVGTLLFISYGSSPVIDYLLITAPFQAGFDALLGLILVPFLIKYSDITWDKIFKPKKTYFKKIIIL